ncbi:hypothetical protein ACXWPT_09545, partial [Streptococcus pyogenes]
ATGHRGQLQIGLPTNRNGDDIDRVLLSIDRHSLDTTVTLNDDRAGLVFRQQHEDAPAGVAHGIGRNRGILTIAKHKHALAG